MVHFTALGNGSNKNSLVASWKDRHSHFSQLLSAAVAAAVSVATLHQHQGESIIFNGMELVDGVGKSKDKGMSSYEQNGFDSDRGLPVGEEGEKGSSFQKEPKQVANKPENQSLGIPYAMGYPSFQTHAPDIQIPYSMGYSSF